MFWKKHDKFLINAHFNSLEFQCKCNYFDCVRQKIDEALISKLVELRFLIGNKPIRINSGYRCMKHNDDQGSNRFSQHPGGTAVDIHCDHLTSGELSQFAEEVGFNGIGVYPNFVHVDVRGYTARWRY